MSNTIQILKSVDSERSVFDWGDLTWFASRQLGNSQVQTIGRCVLAPGKSNPRHFHPNCSEVLVVVSGCIAHTIAEGAEIELGAGDTVTIPAKVWHSARNIGTENAVLFIAFSSANRETVGE